MAAGPRVAPYPRTGARGALRGPAVARAAVYAVLIAATIVTIAPVLWMVVTSFKTQSEFLRGSWSLPQEPTAAAYGQLFRTANFLRYFANSAIITLSTVGLVLAVASMAAFALSRYQFRGRGTVLSYLLLGQMIPATVLLVPLYLTMRQLSLINTYPALILSYTSGALPLTVFLLRGFFLSIPREIEDAARIDGASDWDIYWRIVMPLGAPGLATAGIFEFLFAWNEIVLAMVLMQRPIMRPLMIAVFQAIGEYGPDVPSLFAGLTVASLPVVLAYVLFTRQFIRGITAGALKG